MQTKRIELINNKIGLSRLNFSFYACLLFVFFDYMRLQEKYSIFHGIRFGDISGIIFLIIFFLVGNTFSYKHKINKYIIIFSIWMVITSLIGINPSASFEYLTDIFKLFLIYFLTINTINSKKQLYYYVLMFLVLYFSYTNFSLRQWAVQGFYSGVHGTFVGSGYFHNANDFGAALCAFWGISLGMIFGDKKILGFLRLKWFHIMNTLFFILAIMITSSRGASVALAVSAIYAIMKTKKRILYSILLIIVGVIYISLISPPQLERFEEMGTEQDKTAQDRIENWKAAIHMFKDYPIAGVGIGNYVEANQTIYKKDIPYVPHNIYLQALSEMGLPGLMILGMMIIAFFKNQRAVKNILTKRSIADPFYANLANGLNISMVGFLAAGFFITVLFYPFMWINLTISAVLRKIVEQESSLTNPRHQAEKRFFNPWQPATQTQFTQST